MRVWSTTLDQMAHQDTDPRLITQQLGVDYDPTKTYKLAIIDQAEAVKQADAITMVPTYDNLKAFIKENLDGYDTQPKLLDQVMTPEYSKQYEALVRDMPDSAWNNPQKRDYYLSSRRLGADSKELFEARFDIHDATGANPHFAGNGLTRTTSSTSKNPIYGAVETFSLHKNPKTFRQMTGMKEGHKWVELVDLKPIELGN